MSYPYIAGLATDEDTDWSSVKVGEPMPPDEILSGDRLREVAFLYAVSEQTVRAWRNAHRGDRKRRGAGPPRRK